MDLEDGSMDDIPSRPMRVKILYTFDKDNATNCLARIPDVLNIPAVAIDETSQVGVIELKQCLQAVVSASPEIISRLSDGDFTIYAYDYSEYDTPLVGQGMLSAALAASTPVSQGGKTMITGRICKNALAMLGKVKEILEVKLRLTPVPKPAQTQQNDFGKGMNMGGERSMSPAVSTGFDPNQWNRNATSQQQQQMSDYFNFDSLTSSQDNDRDTNLIDDIFGLGTSSSGSGASGHQLLGGVGIAETPTDPFNPAFSHSAPGSRAGSPIIAPDAGPRNDLLRHQSFSGHPSTFGGPAADNSRPGSRASVRSEVNHQRQASTPVLHHPQPQPKQQELLQQTEVYYNEDGQPRKRAKVTQTDWRGRSSFGGSRSADLRVAASNAASMHMHRPIAKRPAAPGSNLEPPPRVPTPVPQRTVNLPQQQIAPRRSLLRQASAADSDFMSDVDNFSDAIVSSPEEGDESPGNSITAEGTPQEIPSSPPVFPGMNAPQPSSPGALPTLPPPGRLADSGYMSDPRGFGSNVVESLEQDEADRSPDAHDYEVAARYKPRKKNAQSQLVIGSDGHAAVQSMPPTYPSEGHTEMNISMETPGDMNQLPSRMLLNLPPQRKDRESSQGPKNRPPSSAGFHQRFGSNPGPLAIAMQGIEAITQAQSAATPSEAPASRRGSLALPPRPLEQPSDPTNPAGLQRPPQPKKRQSIQRSRTSSNESEAGSPAPSDNEGPGGKPKGTQRSGSGAQRRRVIEQRLQDSIAKGQMPQYCSHCGAIETPTWRKVYVKQCTGKPSALDEAEGEGETVGVQVTDWDRVTGEPSQFVIRKSMKKTKDSQPGEGFEDTMVCNPCGLWFNKFRSMRPPEKWGRRSGTRRPRKSKNADVDGEVGMSTDGLEPQSEAFFTDQVGPDDVGEDGDVDGEGQVDGADEKEQEQEQGLPQMPQPSTNRPRANSLSTGEHRRGGSSQTQWNASKLNNALTRAVQSSPVRLEGSQHSPIEVDDLTPKPTRRLLFPSPRRDGEVKSLDDNAQVSLKALPPSPSAAGARPQVLKEGLEISFDPTQTDACIFEAFTFDKENLAPGIFDTEMEMGEEELARLFENGSPIALFKTPFKTATRKSPRLNGNGYGYGSRERERETVTVTPRSHRQLSHLLKTPTPGRSRKRAPLPPNANAADGATLTSAAAGEVVNDFMTSPSSGRYFLRSTPSRASRTNTPARLQNSSGGGNGVGISPFSKHLAEMLSDANQTDGDGVGGSHAWTSSPSRAFGGGFDFSDLPTFTTPGRPGGLTEADWEGLDGMLSSEFAEFEGEEGSGL